MAKRNTKENRNLSTIVVLLLILTLLALIALSETYSKYTTAQKGTGTAVIAKWEINFKNGATDLSDNFDIDLASTMTSKDKANNFIQPGSKGSFKITVENKSQVPATVVAKVSDSSSTIFKNGQFVLTTTDGTDDNGVTITPNNSKEVTVNWEWKYEVADSTATVDAADTTIGQSSNGAANTICGITLSAVQVDPNA